MSKMRSVLVIFSMFVWGYAEAAHKITKWIPVSFFAREEQQESYEYQLRSNGKITVSLVSGSCTVETWGKPYAVVRVMKKTRFIEDQELVKVHVDQTINHLKLRVEQPMLSIVDMVLVVPAQAHVEIKIKEQGDIKIVSAPRNLVIFTESGDIDFNTLIDGNCDARSHEGDIQAVCHVFSSESSLFLQASHGSAYVFIPHLTQANIDISTVRGSISCDMPVLVDAVLVPRVTKHSWKRLNKHCKGKLGEGGAPITIIAEKSVRVCSTKKERQG